MNHDGVGIRMNWIKEYIRPTLPGDGHTRLNDDRGFGLNYAFPSSSSTPFCLPFGPTPGTGRSHHWHPITSWLASSKPDDSFLWNKQFLDPSQTTPSYGSVIRMPNTDFWKSSELEALKIRLREHLNQRNSNGSNEARPNRIKIDEFHRRTSTDLESSGQASCPSLHRTPSAFRPVPPSSADAVAHSHYLTDHSCPSLLTIPATSTLNASSLNSSTPLSTDMTIPFPLDMSFTMLKSFLPATDSPQFKLDHWDSNSGETINPTSSNEYESHWNLANVQGTAHLNPASPTVYTDPTLIRDSVTLSSAYHPPISIPSEKTGSPTLNQTNKQSDDHLTSLPWKPCTTKRRTYTHGRYPRKCQRCSCLNCETERSNRQWLNNHVLGSNTSSSRSNTNTNRETTATTSSFTLAGSASNESRALNAINSKAFLLLKPGSRKVHLCALCGKTYGKTSHLKAHLRWHNDERPFRCVYPLCTKAFTRSDELQRHMRTHTGEKRFACDQCEKRFMRSDHLNKHKKTHEFANSLNGTVTKHSVASRRERGPKTSTSSTVSANVCPSVQTIPTGTDIRVKAHAGTARLSNRSKAKVT